MQNNTEQNAVKELELRHTESQKRLDLALCELEQVKAWFKIAKTAWEAQKERADRLQTLLDSAKNFISTR